MIKRLKQTKYLAELIGIMLGDGNLFQHPRTQRLCVVEDSREKQYAVKICSLIKKVFNKKPSMQKRKKENVYQIYLYQCNIAERLGLPVGNKIKNNVGVSDWIMKKRTHMKYCLKGLFETDGCFQEDRENYAQFIELKNFCGRIKQDVYSMLVGLGHTPQISKTYVRLARKAEVYKFKNFINFRKYHCPVV